MEEGEEILRLQLLIGGTASHGLLHISNSSMCLRNPVITRWLGKLRRRHGKREMHKIRLADYSWSAEAAGEEGESETSAAGRVRGSFIPEHDPNAVRAACRN